MSGNDEIIFTGAYKDFKLAVHFDLSGKEPMDVAAVLAYISETIEPFAFKFSGIDTAAVDKLAGVNGKGSGAAVAALESRSPTELRGALLKAAREPALYSAAEAYFVNRLLSNAGVAFKASPPLAIKPSEEEIADFIGFVGKYGNWVAVKKLGLEKVQDYEVSGILAGINHTVVNKAFDFAGSAKGGAAIAAGKRKSFGNLLQCLRELGGKDTYVVCKSLEAIGYKPYASPEMLTDAHPDIKPPKVKGRKPKA
jgi:hypothetical protein